MNNKNYADFIIDQLVEDPDFQRWVLDPTTEDLLFWQEFLVEAPGQLEKITEARRMVLERHGRSGEAELPTDRKSAMHRRLVQNVRQERSRKRRRVLSLSAAASVLLLILAGLYFWQSGLPTDDNQLLVITTPYGQTEKAELPDGSVVILNANSRLSYYEHWETGADREVWLEGEAHFTVEPKPATGAKFLVNTSDLSVKVLGTVFNVYARSQGTRVTLEEGKVTLELKEVPEDRSIVEMQPGDQVRFSARTQEFSDEEVDATAKNSWKDGIIIFDGITLGELGGIITETFGMEVTFKDEQRSRQTITGAGPADDLDLLIQNVEKALKINIIQQDSLLIFN
ncbi:FecR family protein [Flavilitoribacter nigricans]|uniref:FecR protein domain-containing protein n=1 Tax=Flavilitoribacter nigricans (strain ATCC 23147 / DSM 23189 / NBRC 102662 / NCIMB 1420 / SS-2) TaxID=1122177 RepID=A0A2D0NHJ7_FLAN2|nr:FecR domain-containing protein [Flavilitoribacter nigricans]PHN07888.1 hypothetical protein CRP01_03810 [Flavilitoribacter nigricans DSM 23189 = NBRC 102662]